MLHPDMHGLAPAASIRLAATKFILGMAWSVADAWRRRTRGFTLVTAVCVSLVVGLPQLRYFADGHRHAVIQDGDEMAYAAKVRDAIDGHWRAASPYVWEHKDAPALTPYGGEVFLGGLARVTGLDLDSVVILTRFLSPAVSAVLLVRILFLLTGSTAWAALGAGVILLEPGTYYYKPVYFFTRLVSSFSQPSDMPLLYSRFLNPLLLIIPFLVAVLFLIRALERQERTDVVIAGVAVGVNFYTQPYYSTYLLLWLALLVFLYIRDGGRRRVILSIALIGILCGSYAIVENAQKFHGPGLEVVRRFGGYSQTRAPYYLFHKGIVLSVLAFAIFYRGASSLTYWFLLSGMLGGYLLLNQHLLTGREILNYHYNYPNAVIAACAMVVLAKDWLSAPPRPVSAERWGRWLGLAGTVFAVWLVVNGLMLQSQTYAQHMRSALPAEGGYPSNLKERFADTIAWINANTPRDAVFLADRYVSFVIPVFAHANVFLNPDLGDDAIAFMSDQELFERHMTYFRIAGRTAPDVFAMVRSKPAMPFPTWKFGRDTAMRRKYDFSATEPFWRVLKTDALANDYVAAFQRFSRGDAEDGLKKYRLDYLVLSQRDPAFRGSARSYFSDTRIKPVAELSQEGVEIFKISAPLATFRP